jgi:predicted Zn finger-like uncharacterized protein
MAKIMWVVCPECEKKFYVATDDFKDKDRLMLCPFCAKRFTDKEAKGVFEDHN